MLEVLNFGAGIDFGSAERACHAACGRNHVERTCFERMRLIVFVRRIKLFGFSCFDCIVEDLDGFHQIIDGNARGFCDLFDGIAFEYLKAETSKTFDRVRENVGVCVRSA